MTHRPILQYVSVQWVAEGLLWLLLAFVPWPFGAVSAASEAVVALLVTALGLCLVWRFLFERREFVGTWTLAPLLALLAVVFLSILPLPEAWLTLLSPHGVQIRQNLLSHLPPSSTDAPSLTLSFYPLATAHMARLIIGSLVVFTAVINFCRRQDAIRRLLIAITVVGGVLGAQAVVQSISSNGLIYWTIHAPTGKATSGPFVNYNNFCQFMNLCMGAGLGLLLHLVHQRSFYGRSHALLGRWELLGDNGRRYVMLLFVMLLLGGLGVLLSTSRGGVLAMAGAGMFTVVVLVTLRDVGVPLKLLSLLGLVLVCLLLTIGLDTFLARMETLSDLESASGARWQVFHDVLKMIPQFAVIGTGLGTHEFVYPMFSHLTTWRNAQYVENEYLQLVEEMGAVGAVLVAAFVTLLVVNFIQAVRRRELGLGYAAVGLGYGLLAITLGSITDFGQRLASVSSLTAVVCGLVIAIRHVDNPATPPRRLKHSPGLALSLVTLALVAWTLMGATRAALAEYHWNQVLPLEQQVIASGWQGSQEQFNQLVDHAQAAADWEPGNVEYQTWLQIYRWHNGIREAPWNAMTDAQRGAMFQNLVQALQHCERLCPTYGLSYAMAGQIRDLGLRDKNGAAEIHKAFSLAPTHPAVCFIAGRLSVAEGQWDEARVQFGRALALRYSKNDVLSIYVNEAQRPDLAVPVFQDDWEMLNDLAYIMEKDPAFANQAPDIRLRSQAVLTADAQKPEASVQTLAAMADLLGRQGDLAGAVRYYRRALEGQYENAQWHFALANILAQRGDSDQAREELRISLRATASALSERQRATAEQMRWDLSHPAPGPASSTAPETRP